jgi:cytochrome c oxidase subunit 2
MPEGASTTSQNIDAIFYFILGLTTFFFVIMMGAMFLFVWRYRKKSAAQRTSPIEGHTRLEIAWSAIPTVFLVIIFAWGFVGWMDLNVPPDDTLDVYVTGQKWSWSYNYETEGVVGATELVVPIRQPVKLIMSSMDVLHSFYVPAFRIKRDVLPKRYSVVWFEATREGEFQVFCAEYCGRDHSRMMSTVRVVSDEEFREWVASQKEIGGDPVTVGAELYKARGCEGCHNGELGPDLAGIFGTVEECLDGEVEVDEDYLRESILEPMARVVKGYNPVMPSFQGQLSDEQLFCLIAYIKSLSGVETEGGAPVEQAVATTEALDQGKVGFGKQLYGQKGCVSCHGPDGGGGIGPVLKDFYGSTQTLTAGNKIRVDDIYLAKAVREPSAFVIQGYEDKVMAPVRLTEEELEALVEYMKSLSSAGGADGDGGSDAGGEADLVAKGKELYATKACIGCHTLDGNVTVGPSFKGLYGKEEQLTDGSTIVVDDAYIAESIKEPMAKIPVGFEGRVMTPMPVTDEDIKALTAYIKSLQ